MIIVLVGMPGCGKSTVGRQLARRLQLAFVDTDHQIEQRLGCTIREFFEREGEARFRDVEQEVLASVMATEHGGGADAGLQPGVVVATGGGSVLRPPNRACLRAAAQVFYLWSSPDELYRRLRHDQNRPLLQVGDPLGRLRELYEQRDALYRETAHHVVQSHKPSTTALVQRILAIVQPAAG